MADISASTIKELREKTGAGMMDCKKALAENNGDLEQAVDWLRKKGLAAAAKKAGRTAAEGLIALAYDGAKGVIIELNSETDFVARNDQFQALAENIAKAALAQGTEDVEQLKKAQTASGKTVEEDITGAIATIGENISLRRIASVSVNNGAIAHYVHNTVKPGLGKIGVLVAIETTSKDAKIGDFGKQVAMHIAAAKPEALHREHVDPAKLEREKSVLRDQVIVSGKPAEIAEKMLEGRIRKYYEEVVLHEQLFVMDGKTKIADIIAQVSKDVGSEIKVTDFKLFVLGEGIERDNGDFAAEVKAAVGA